MKNYPLPIRSGKETLQLNGIGPQTAKRLDAKLAKVREIGLYSSCGVRVRVRVHVCAPLPPSFGCIYIIRVSAPR